jgi:hypothetical protein
MQIRSVHDRRYSRRFIIMGIVILGFALWSLYDGAVKYPREQARALEYERLAMEERTSEWDEIADEKGWSTAVPGAPKEEQEHIDSVKMQYAMAILAGAIGLPMLLVALRSRSQWIEGTSSGLTSSWGERLNFDQIIQLDKKQWRKKGIAKLTYLDGDRKRRFVLDDYKFERHSMDAILYEIEQRIDAAMIVNGPPEPRPEQPGQQPAEPL